jgi:hypothetical protein
MSATVKSNVITLPNDYTAEHARLVKEREDAKTPGVRAGAMRRLALFELELTIQGRDFTPYEPPTPVTKSTPSLSDEDLMSRIADVRRVSQDANVVPHIRNTASQVLAKLTKTAQSRGLIETEEETETPKTTRKTKTETLKSSGKTGGEMLEEVESNLSDAVA